jgi:hypothetical protein
MGMDHYYGFIDRAVVDPLWSLKWKTVVRRYPNKWVNSMVVDPDAYNEASLRELLTFAIDPQPSLPQIERILEKDTLKDTLRRCHPQYWTMWMLLTRLPQFVEAIKGFSIHDTDDLVNGCVDAYLNHKIAIVDLWPVLKLHSVKLGEVTAPWLDADARLALRTQLPWKEFWKPVYSWQSTSACRNDNWTNCLSTADTLRFVKLILRAERENWPMSASPTRNGLHFLHFRDLPDAADIADTAKKVMSRFVRPFVYREWS